MTMNAHISINPFPLHFWLLKAQQEKMAVYYGNGSFRVTAKSMFRFFRSC
jgi:hypothetical protein